MDRERIDDLIESATKHINEAIACTKIGRLDTEAQTNSQVAIAQLLMVIALKLTEETKEQA
jgi:hypothetical protein